MQSTDRTMDDYTSAIVHRSQTYPFLSDILVLATSLGYLGTPTSDSAKTYKLKLS